MRAYIEMDLQGNHWALPFVPPGNIFSRPVVFVVNSAAAVIRTAILPDGYKLNAKTKWEQVQAAFPFGRAINEQTHLFDGSVYRNADGRAVFCMVALPLEISEAITNHGAAIPGGIRKVAALETMETVLFRHIAAQQTQAARWMIYPCEHGIKILIVNKNAPEAVRFLPAGAPYLEDALRRTLTEMPPEEVLLPNRSFWGETWTQTRADIKRLLATQEINVVSIQL